MEVLGPVALYTAFALGLALWVRGGMVCPSLITMRKPALIGALVGVAVAFLPKTSPISALVLVLSFVVGMLSLGYALNERWSARTSSFTLRLVIVFVSMTVAMLVMALPLVLLVHS